MEQNEVKRTLATEVKKFRLKKGWTTEDLAQRSGTNKLTIYNLENEEYGNLPQTRTIVKVAKALGCKLEELLHS